MLVNVINNVIFPLYWSVFIMIYSIMWSVTIGAIYVLSNHFALHDQFLNLLFQVESYFRPCKWVLFAVRIDGKPFSDARNDDDLSEG